MKRILLLPALLFLLPIFPVYADEIAPPIELTDAPTISADWSKSDTQSVILGGNRKLDFLNGQKGARYLLILTQDKTGSRTVTWPSSVRWPGDSPLPPGYNLLTSTANKTDYFIFYYNGLTYDVLSIAQHY